MRQKRHVIGIDVGLNSVGLAAIELDETEMPVRILKAMSVIHDGGVDPNSQKSGDSRRQQAGIARRTRRMRRRRKARLARLDKKLSDLGFPIVDEKLLRGFDVWRIRALAASEYIENEDERKRAISIACRHVARHRGWRNPYIRAESLLSVDAPSSEQYQQLRDNAIAILGGEYIPETATPAQIIDAVLAENHGPATRIRTSTGSKKLGTREGLISTRLMQADYAYELRTIFKQQHVPEEVARELILAIFETKSPRGSAERRAGHDALDTTEMRASKASLAFQRYRIANISTNLRVLDGNALRPLTVDEKQRVYQRLASQQTEEHLLWNDICKELGLPRNRLKGVGSLTQDGEERVTSRPPQLTSVQRIMGLKDPKLRKLLQQWWNETDDSAHEAMIALLSNTVDIDDKREDPIFIEAIEFIERLDDDALTKLDSIDLPSGRAAYSVKTLNKLTRRMLDTDDDLHAARKALFGVDDNWRPPQPPINAPLGNAAVDRVLRIVHRFLVAAQRRWGDPESVQIEHVRNGFSSIPTARQDKRDYESYLTKRNTYRAQQAENLKKEFGLDTVRDYDLRRIECITRQNGECLYCGRTITFKTCEMDHIVPRKGVGSTNTRNNFAAVCEECNRSKSNMPFAVWAQTDVARQRGVSFEDAIARVKMFNIDSSAMSSREAKDFMNSVIARLRQTEQDEPIDNRSIESVAWMADELHRRIDWYYNSARYMGVVPADTPIATRVSVYQGSITAEARKASQIDGRIHFAGARYKTRLDRRHHAVDAAVIAIMTPGAAQSLQIRRNLHIAQNAIGHIEKDEVAWNEYPTPGNQGYAAYGKWAESMHALLNLLNDALDAGRIPVTHLYRYSLGNSVAHDATIHSLVRIPLSNAMDAKMVAKASTPALYCALTRLPEYSPKNGLPEDAHREITVNGTHYTVSDNVTFFSRNGAQIAVQHGSADIGCAIHHARIYKWYKENRKGERTYSYGMIRVFQADLLRAVHEDLFTCILPEQSVSMRYADHNVVDAIRNNRAEYKGYLIAGDEIELDFPDDVSDQLVSFLDLFEQDLHIDSAILGRWVVTGFESATRINLRPSVLAFEGLSKVLERLDVDSKVLADVNTLFSRSWRLTVGKILPYKATVVRRNTLGEKRYVSYNHMPVCWSFD